MASSLLLLAGALASVAALANCSTGAGDPEVNEDDITITGPNNRMGLRLVYDEPTGSVRATLNKPLAEGEQLRLQVRRGRLSRDSQRKLDCKSLPVAPANELPNAATGRVVYEGPPVDASLLTSVYGADWVRGKITPKMIDDLARDGADAIVEACIMNGDKVRARIQTSVAYAWDLGAASARNGLGRQSLNVHINAGDAGGGGEEAPAALHSIEKYTEACVAELGDIPFFKKTADGSYETFDCRDFVGQDGQPIEGVTGALVPQSQHDAQGADTTPAECDDRPAEGHPNCFKTCDRPSWASQTCEPGPTVTTARNDKGTHWVLLCRSTGTPGGKATTASLLATKTFNDIAMIGHNPKTGKTCFFQNKIFDGTDGAHVSHPADVEKSRHIWDEPKGHCTGCHSADAFIHSPWIDAAKRPDGSPMVPMMGQHPDFEISFLSTPYSVVNREAQAAAHVGGSGWDKPKQLVSEGADACMTCHRIGNGDGMKILSPWAVGEPSTDVPANGTDPLLTRWTPFTQMFENSHWMPLRLDGLDAENWPSSRFAKAVAHIKTCAADNAAAGCEWADVPER